MARIKATHHVVFILVHGLGPEIADMLRYDSCAPADEPEAHKLRRAIAGDGPAEWIILKRYVPVGAPTEPTVGRWPGFGYVAYPTAFNDFYEADGARDGLKSLPNHGLTKNGRAVL